MQLNITGNNVEITEALRDLLQPNLPNLSNILTESTRSCCSESGESHPHLRCNTACKRGEIHASAEGQDMYAAIDGLMISWHAS